MWVYSHKERGMRAISPKDDKVGGVYLQDKCGKYNYPENNCGKVLWNPKDDVIRGFLKPQISGPLPLEPRVDIPKDDLDGGFLNPQGRENRSRKMIWLGVFKPPGPRE